MQEERLFFFFGVIYRKDKKIVRFSVHQDHRSASKIALSQLNTNDNGKINTNAFGVSGVTGAPGIGFGENGQQERPQEQAQPGNIEFDKQQKEKEKENNKNRRISTDLDKVKSTELTEKQNSFVQQMGDGLIAQEMEVDNLILEIAYDNDVANNKNDPNNPNKPIQTNTVMSEPDYSNSDENEDDTTNGDMNQIQVQNSIPAAFTIGAGFEGNEGNYND